MLNPGDFDKKITVQQQVVIPNEYKQEIEKFVDYARPWANIKTTLSSEAIVAGNLSALKESRFILRYSKKLALLLKTDEYRFRIIYKNQKYDVISAINDDELDVTITVVGKVVQK